MSGRKTYSFGVKISSYKSEPIPVLDSSLFQDTIKKTLDKYQEDLLNDLFKTPRVNNMSDAVYEIVSCPACQYDHAASPPCEVCGGRNRHPIPMSELYSPERFE